MNLIRFAFVKCANNHETDIERNWLAEIFKDTINTCIDGKSKEGFDGEIGLFWNLRALHKLFRALTEEENEIMRA